MKNGQSHDEGTGGFLKREKNEYNKLRPVGDRCTVVGHGELLDMIEAITRAGGYVSFGQTTDGGALLIRVLDGNDKISSYCHSRTELLECIQAFKQEYGQTWPKALPQMKS